MTRRLLTTLAALALLALTAVPSFAITTKEIADLGNAGVADDLIITLIQSSDVVPTLDPQGVINLKAAGVSDNVIRILLTQKEQRNDAFEYDQAVRRSLLMNFQFPEGYFDNTYSGITKGYGGSLTPIRPQYRPYGYGAGYPATGGGGLLGDGYYPDYLRTDGDAYELNYNLGDSNPGVLYDEMKWDDLWSLNFALFGRPSAKRLYFRN